MNDVECGRLSGPHSLRYLGGRGARGMAFGCLRYQNAGWRYGDGGGRLRHQNAGRWHCDQRLCECRPGRLCVGDCCSGQYPNTKHETEDAVSLTTGPYAWSEPMIRVIEPTHQSSQPAFGQLGEVGTAHVPP
jgi:hypothetical protein